VDIDGRDGGDRVEGRRERDEGGEEGGKEDRDRKRRIDRRNRGEG
jgi:hypothetical protein